jgi:hypothetical protein
VLLVSIALTVADWDSARTRDVVEAIAHEPAVAVLTRLNIVVREAVQLPRKGSGRISGEVRAEHGHTPACPSRQGDPSLLSSGVRRLHAHPGVMDRFCACAADCGSERRM